MKFRKKPVIIEAVQHFDDVQKFEETNYPIPFWLHDAVVSKTIYTNEYGTYVKTKEGPLKVSDGDWIVMGFSSELGYHFWPVKPDYFAENYEPV